MEHEDKHQEQQHSEQDRQQQQLLLLQQLVTNNSQIFHAGACVATRGSRRVRVSAEMRQHGKFEKFRSQNPSN